MTNKIPPLVDIKTDEQTDRPTNCMKESHAESKLTTKAKLLFWYKSKKKLIMVENNINLKHFIYYRL